jgi:hypothetical protein
MQLAGSTGAAREFIDPSPQKNAAQDDMVMDYSKNKKLLALLLPL